MSLNFHRLADQEVLDAVAYYEKRAPGLGADFLVAVEEACDLLMRHPKAAPIVQGDEYPWPLRGLRTAAYRLLPSSSARLRLQRSLGN